MAVIRRVGFFVLSAALLFSLGGTALADHTVGHAAQQIDQIVDEAKQRMAARADAFESEVQSATSEKQIDSLRQAANAEVHDISTQAASDVDAAAQGYDKELRNKVKEAKQELEHGRNDAKARINAAAEKAKQNLASSSTTTTAQNTTTTAQGPTPTTSQPGVTTTTELGTGGPSEGATPPPSAQTPLEKWAASAFVSGQSEKVDEPAPTRSGIVVALETVLPRDLIDWAMSPFRIFWVIVRTTVEGGRAVLYPAAALAMSAIVLGVIEARFRQRAFSRGKFSTG